MSPFHYVVFIIYLYFIGPIIYIYILLQSSWNPSCLELEYSFKKKTFVMP